MQTRTRVLGTGAIQRGFGHEIAANDIGETSKILSEEALSLKDVIAREASFIAFALHTHGVHSRDQDDAAQEVLLAVYRGLATFDVSRARDPQKALHSWIWAICQRIGANHRRRRARLAEDPTDQEVLSIEPIHAVPPAEQAYLEIENQRLVWSLLDQIPEERAAVVRAYDLEETPMETVARTLGIPINTGWNRRRLGIQDLRAALARRTAAEIRASFFAANNGSSTST